MTFEEWWREFWGDSWKDGAPVPDFGDSPGQIEQTKIACQEAWHAGFYQGRVHESGNNMAKQIDDEILGILKSAQETEK